MPSPALAARLAYASGLALARYGRWAVRIERVHLEGLEGWPSPAIGANWHEGGLIGLTVHAHFKQAYAGLSFVPPGLLGDAMRGWLAGHGSMAPVTLPPDRQGNPQAALKAMARGLRGGQNVFVAVDGPHGPVRRVRPGVVWLARQSGRPIVPVGTAAWPAIRWPKWDRHITPLPGARAAAIYGAALWVGRDADLDAAAEDLSARLVKVNARAWQVVRAPRPRPAPAADLETLP
jgi:lysophospholipid acyltransferase (LPLAT)-like uncharacterized protein